MIDVAYLPALYLYE